MTYELMVLDVKKESKIYYIILLYISVFFFSHNKRLVVILKTEVDFFLIYYFLPNVVRTRLCSLCSVHCVCGILRLRSGMAPIMR